MLMQSVGASALLTNSVPLLQEALDALEQGRLLAPANQALQTARERLDADLTAAQTAAAPTSKAQRRKRDGNVQLLVGVLRLVLCSPLEC